MFLGWKYWWEVNWFTLTKNLWWQKNIFGFLLLLLHNQPKQRESEREKPMSIYVPICFFFLLGYFLPWKAVVSQLKFDKIQRNMKPFTLKQFLLFWEKVNIKIKNIKPLWLQHKIQFFFFSFHFFSSWFISRNIQSCAFESNFFL